MKCPVCNRSFKTTTDGIDLILCEEYGQCRCGYSCEFAFGFTRHECAPFAVVEGYTNSQWQAKWNRCKLAMLVAFWKVVTFGGCITVEEER